MTPASPEPPLRTGGRVVVNTASLSAASLWRIGVAFAIQVLIARRLGAAALGDYAVVLAWLYVGQIVLEAGLPASTVRMLAGHPERRRAAHRQVMRIQCLLSALAWAALVACAMVIPAMQSRLPLMAVAGASLPFYAIMSATGTIFEASERMDHVFMVDSVTNALLLVATAAVLWTGRGVEAALAVLVVVQGFSAILAIAVLRRSGLLREPQEAAAPPWRVTLRAATSFFYLSLADVLQQRADLLLLSALASPQVAGIYAAANSLVRVLIKVVQAYWRALYPTLSRLYDARIEGYRMLGDMAQRFVLAATLPAAAIGAAVSAGVVALIFGPDYAAAGLVLAALVPSAPLYAWELRSVTALLAERQQRRALWIAGAHLCLLLILLPPLAISMGAPGAALATTVAAGAGAIVGSTLARHSAAAPADRRVLWMMLASLGAAALAVAFELLGLPWWVAAIVATLLYGLLVAATRALSRRDVVRLRSSLAPQGR